MEVSIVPTNVDAAALAASLRRLHEHPQAHTLRASLQQVIDACVQLFSVTGSGLMVADAQGVLRYAVASDGPSKQLEDVQLEVGEGPCVLAFVRDELVATSDAGADERWPLVRDGIATVGEVSGAAQPPTSRPLISTSVRAIRCGRRDVGRMSRL